VVVGVFGDVCREGFTLAACPCEEDDTKGISSLGKSGSPGGLLRRCWAGEAKMLGRRSCSKLPEFAGNKRGSDRKKIKRKNKGQGIFKTIFRNLILFSKTISKL
jgi:hypothetical protein